ncbi:Aspartate aminotransferase (EC [Olavius algarvensis associated proteobacterium Delta 3]|nr:Aspartate aminotransferase (EC [Olavius algarvensis associated proteobacterium Delta 3]
MPLKPINTYIQEMQRSGIRRIMDSATAPDILHLEVGQPNFSTPEPILRAACEAIMDAQGRFTRYTPNMGYVTLREKIAAKLKEENGIQTSPGRILVTPGSNYGIMIALSVLLNPNDEVLAPDPGYVNYAALPPQFGCTVGRYPLYESDEFTPRIDSIAACITPATKVIVHNSPSNPTGAVCPESFVKELVALARENNLYVLSDEAYEHIVFDGRHISPARFDTNGNVVSIFSVSKSYSMTGWRLGYVVSSEPVARALEKQQELCVSCAPSISQKAAEAALSLDHGYINEMVDQYRMRRDMALNILKRHGLFRYTPKGAFYVLIDISATGMDSNTFADRLLEEQRVAVAPGATFGPLAETYIRVSMATEDHVLVKGLEKICDYINMQRY